VAAVDVGILGPLRVTGPDGVVDIAGARPRRLLSALALWLGEPLSAERLIDLVWGDVAPNSAANALQAQVSKLRRQLGAAVIATHVRAYQLDLGPDAVDAHRFESGFALGSAALASGDPARAAAALSEALSAWRGSALSDLDHPDVLPHATRLEELRLVALEHRIDADLQLGRHLDVVAELESLTAAHPTRERLWAQAMVALYRSGRQADALHTFQSARRTLAIELGLEPGPELRRLESAIVSQDPSLDLPSAPSWAAPAGLAGSVGLAGPRVAADPSAAVLPPSSPPGNLPVERTSFVGRGGELRSVAEALADHRLVTLIGPGGAGKTRLALAAGRVAPPPGGVWLVELASVTDGEDIAGLVAAALGAVDQALAPLVSRKALARATEFLGQGAALLIVDNCEHLIAEVAAVVDDLLSACPALTVLATSREGLGIPGERLLAVPPLAIDDAADLFVGRAVAAGADPARLGAERAMIIDICRRLDGLPLAIELAAARVRHLSLTELADRLDDRFRLLTGGARSALPRQQTLRAVVDWSYDLLEEPERLVFQRLSAFSGGWSLSAAEAVAGGGSIDPADVASILGGLADKSLVVPAHDGGHSRYHLLQTLWLYARERLAAASAGEAATARDRHLAHFGAWAERAHHGLRGPHQAQWLADTRTELENLRGALDWARARGGDPAALVIGEAVAWYWFLDGGLEEGLAFLEEALAAGPPGDSAMRARLLSWRHWVAMMLGDHTAADGLAEALEMARRVDDPMAIGQVKLLQAEADQTGDAAHHQVNIKESIETFAELGYEWGVGIGGIVGGFNAFGRGDLAVAEAAFGEAQNAFARAGDLWGEGFALGEIASFAEMRGDYEQATAQLYRSIELIDRSGARFYRDVAWSRLGNLALLQGDLATAERYHIQALERSERSRQMIVGVMTLLARSLSLRMAGRYEEARLLLSDAASRIVPASMPIGVAAIESGLGYVAEHQGRVIEAANHHRAALRAALAWGDQRSVAQAVEGLAGAAASGGDGERAAWLLGVGHRLRTSNGGPMPAAERRLEVDRIEAAARELLGDGEFAASFAAGFEADPGFVAAELAEATAS
jgi:predicted ATPase/DNA-binding SARP family transcriptional activator